MSYFTDGMSCFQLQQGKVFNIESGKRALNDVFSLGLFTMAEVNPRPDEKEGGIAVEIKLKETEQKTADITTDGV